MASLRTFELPLLCMLLLAPGWTPAAARAEPPADAAKAEAQAKPSAKPEPEPAEPDATRAQRRAAWRAMMHGLRSPAELPAPVRQELRTHAWRLARLMRIRALAIGAHDATLTQRADALLAREMARHRERLSRAWPPAQRKRAKAAPAQPRDDDDEERGEREPEETEDPEARP